MYIIKQGVLPQVVSMLRGLRCPGGCFCWEESTDAFEVVPGVHVPELSLGALASVLRHFARSGTLAVRSGLPQIKQGCAYRVEGPGFRDANQNILSQILIATTWQH